MHVIPAKASTVPRLILRQQNSFVAEGDKIAVCYTVEGTHRGTFMSVPPTDKRVSISGITILRFADGQCVERWSEANFLACFNSWAPSPRSRSVQAGF